MPGMLEKLLDQLARVNVMSGISLKVPPVSYTHLTLPTIA